MIKRKLCKAFALGMCLSMLSTKGVAFGAQIDAEKPNEETVLMQEEQEVERVVEPYIGEAKIMYSDAILQKQSEIDQYVFVEHSDKLAELGFKVTHTGPNNEYVEIGIEPYTEDAAKFLYDTFGSDLVRVVEGEQAVMYTTGVAVSPDTPVSNDGSESYVGEDMVLSEGEFGITSVADDAMEITVDTATKTNEVAEVLSDTEVKAVAYDSSIAETTILESTTKKNDNSTLLIILTACVGVAAVGGIAYLAKKKKLI